MLRHQHERRVLVALEDFVGALRHHDRRERPERLPVLDPLVQHVLHLRRARVGDDAAIAERAWPEFGPALKPADHLAFGQHLGRLGADVAAPGLMLVTARTSLRLVASRDVLVAYRCGR